MGTNYYAVGREACGECHRPYNDKQVHIGKSSAGWTFSFAWNDGEYYKTPAEFKKWLKSKTILNEYDEEITHKEFLEMVEAKKDGLTLETYYQKYPDHNKYNTNPDDHELEVGGWRFVKGEFS